MIKPTSEPVAAFVGRLQESLADGSFVRLVLSSPRSAGNLTARVLGRAIELRGRPHLSLTFRHAKQDRTRNLPLDEVKDWVVSTLGGEFGSALLETVRGDWQLSIAAKGKVRLVPHRPRQQVVPSRAHDRPVRDLLGSAARGWLHPLGLTDAEGRTLPSGAAKYQQVRRYLEIFSHLVRDARWREGQAVTLADMGCGKGYLTFGVWHLLRHHLRIPARVIGIENRADLVEFASALARRIGAEGLEFAPGTVADVSLPGLDALIALHACNTATDDALRRGLELGAGLLVVAPCCHQELRPQLRHPPLFAAALRHGILAERMAEWLTDALRTLHLEWAGYRPKAFEFVPSEHTPKNLMIAAVRRGRAFADAEARQRILDLKELFGIVHQALDPWLNSEDSPPAQRRILGR